MKEEILMNQIITNAYINDDKTVIKLRCSDNKYIDLEAASDCCSETWFEHIHGIDALKLGSVIVSIEDKDLGEVIPTRQERDLLYATIFKLNRPDGRNYDNEFGIEYRNSSNGYYGGYLSVQLGEESLEGFKEINEDF